MVDIADTTDIRTTVTNKHDVPPDVIAKWQGLVDLTADLCAVPTALVSRFHDTNIELIVCAPPENNPFKPGEFLKISTGLYCHAVTTARAPFLLHNAREDPTWADAPQVNRGMVSYLGFPLFWPNGDVFGTICILDNKARTYSPPHCGLILHFREVIESDLARIHDHNKSRKHSVGKRRGFADPLPHPVEDRLRQVQKLEVLGQLAGGVAHDFNNLLTVILHSVERLKRPLEGDQSASEVLGAIEEAAHQAVGVTKSILALGRETPGNKEPVNLQAIIEDAAKLLRRTLPASIELDVTVADSASFCIEADRTQLKQIILNLALNARDAMPEGGSLQISVAHATPDDLAAWADHFDHDPGFVCLSISDTGAGVSPDIQDRIFDPFFTTKPRGKGTGLGLAMVHALVTEHGGGITVHSEPGSGASFRVILPLAEATQTFVEIATPTITPHGCGERLLLAENDAHLRGIVAMFLESAGYQVVQVDDIFDAQHHREQYPDGIKALILDVDLSIDGSLDWLRDIRAANDRIPAIVITDHPTRDLGELRDEVTCLLHKPFKVSELGQIIRGMLANHSQQEAASQEIVS